MPLFPTFEIKAWITLFHVYSTTFFIRYFFIYISNAISKVPIPSSCPAPQPTHSCFLTLAFPCPRAYDLHKTKSLSSHWWPTRPSSATYAPTDISSGGGVLVSSYYCSSYRVADPVSYLGIFSSSFIRSVPSNRWLWASTSVFAKHWHSFTLDSYIRALSVKSSWHIQ